MPWSSIRRVLARLSLVFLALSLWHGPAFATVTVTFHSFNGSVLIGRYPHTFVVFDGKLDDTGQVIHENFGFSAKSVGPSILAGPVEHVIWVEDEKYLKSTNTHFSITVSDATYHRMKQEVAAWRDAPGKYYDLDTRNCIHFVGRIAELGGLKVAYPKEMLRKPKAWLNYIGTLNPQLGAKPIK
ncbi:hypothetical protein [Altererythrobacter sp. Root672]|uniref:hypothetical protein n=1 Tax=Altererythrobacter sp. Root672 TaxID=1736584 RepID=UPI0006FE358A|nr:hypothetical protein [Altererythrobacter sp. Root672]KRA83022.1 hypothetical protein ASD76_02760 [Altererythrobacter sp. Root672]